VKNKLLEQYKMAMMAKRSKKIMERMKEVELERRMLEQNEQKQSTTASQVIPTQKIELNPERDNIFGRFQEPTPNLLRFRNSQTEQKPIKKMSESRKTSLTKGIKLPALPNGPPLPPRQEGLLGTRHP
jgi:hypothetical protein